MIWRYLRRWRGPGSWIQIFAQYRFGPISSFMILIPINLGLCSNFTLWCKSLPKIIGHHLNRLTNMAFEQTGRRGMTNPSKIWWWPAQIIHPRDNAQIYQPQIRWNLTENNAGWTRPPLPTPSMGQIKDTELLKMGARLTLRQEDGLN